MSYSEEKILKYVDNELNEADKKDFLEHLKTCTECREKVENLSKIDVFLKDHFRAVNEEADSIQLKKNFDASVMHEITVESSPLLKLFFKTVKFIVIPAMICALLYSAYTLIPESRKTTSQPAVNITIFGLLKKSEGIVSVFSAKTGWKEIESETNIASAQRIKTSAATSAELFIYDGSFIQQGANCEIEVKDSTTIQHIYGNALYKIAPAIQKLQIVVQNMKLTGNVFTLAASAELVKIEAVEGSATLTTVSENKTVIPEGYYLEVKSGKPGTPQIKRKPVQENIPAPVENLEGNSEDIFKTLSNP